LAWSGAELVGVAGAVKEFYPAPTGERRDLFPAIGFDGDLPQEYGRLSKYLPGTSLIAVVLQEA